MSRPSCHYVLFGLIAGITAPLGVGCSHAQKVAPSVPPVALQDTAAVRKPPTPPQAPQAVPAMAAKEPGPKEIFFDFDSALLRDDARPVLQKVASEVRGKDSGSLEVDGNCDELGTVEYNIALGEQRARAAKDYLVHLGVLPGRIKTLSYGSERPRFAGHDEGARANNRRDDFVVR